MTKVNTQQVDTQVDVKRAVPQFRLPDSESTAEMALQEALNFCAQKMGLDEQRAVVERLQAGDRSASQYFHYNIAQKVGESIGALDQKVKAVYVVDYDATPQDMCFGESAPSHLIHMVVWAERKTNALKSVVNALDQALVRQYADVLGVSDLAHLLDVQVVDDEEVEGRIGYGAMLSSIHNRPIQIWKR